MNFFFFYFKILLFLLSHNKDKIIFSKKEEIKGIFKINSLLNEDLVINENGYLKLREKGNKKEEEIFRIMKTEDNLFHIETKIDQRKLMVDENGNVLVQNRTNNKTCIWNIIKLEEYKYIIQNSETKKFLEVQNYFIKCINYLPLPLKKQNKTKISKKYVFTFLKLYEEVNISLEQEQIIESEPIDVVIKYIDLTDKKLNRTSINQIPKDQDNEELRYSLRSIINNIPWVRKIFILMPNEKVKYFKPYVEIKEKIKYVKDKDLLGYNSANIYAFTFNLFRLKKFGLSNNFI